MPSVSAPNEIPVGSIRTIGPSGKKYEVGKGIRQMDDGRWLVAVTMLETGETFEYSLSRILNDPVVDMEDTVRGLLATVCHPDEREGVILRDEFISRYQR
jgi:hypothetical protein